MKANLDVTSHDEKLKDENIKKGLSLILFFFSNQSI